MTIAQLKLLEPAQQQTTQGLPVMGRARALALGAQ